MKNIHVLPTDKPSRLSKDENDRIWLSINFEYGINDNNKQNIYITSDEEIKEGDWGLDKFNQRWKLEDKKLIAFDSRGIKRFSTDNILGHECKKIILTTDEDLIKNGVQTIDDEFLEWFVKNPSCEEVKVIKTFEDYTIVGGKSDEIYYKIIIPSEEALLQSSIDGEAIWGEEQKQHLIDMMKADEELGLYEEPKQETLEHTSKFIVFTLQDSEDWVQYSIALDSFEKADNFCQQFRDKKMSYLICQTLKQGYNGK